MIFDLKGEFEGNIHPDIFKYYMGNCHDAIAQVFGKPVPGDEFFNMVMHFKLNTARFSAYKTHQVTTSIKSLSKANEKVFKMNAEFLLKKYNRYQVTEYNTVVARSRTAQQFNQFEKDKDLYPNLEWIRTRSSSPRERHLKLVGTIRPINDPFWQLNQPGNLWNCKCDWKTTDKPETSHPGDVKPQPGLAGNPAETGNIFSDDHPYFNKEKNNSFFDSINQNIDLRKESIEKFLSYDNNWTKELWNFDNGGFNVYHKQHQFHQKGGEIEKKVGKMLAINEGKQIEFLKEGGFKVKSADWYFDGETWDLKWIDEANVKTIRSYIEISRKADNAIFYFTKDKLSELHEAVYRTIGHFEKEGTINTLPSIFYIDNGKLKRIWKQIKKGR